LERRLFLLMFRAHRALTVYGNAQTYDALGISTSQLATLQHVSKSPGCSLTDLATLLDLNKSAVTGLVQRMERDGILRRAPDPADRRASLLFVTSKGEEARARSGALIRRLNAELTKGFEPEEMETVVRFLNTLIERCGSSEPNEAEDGA
jgi:MarR family transcriptional regulator, organic hydroperoxide resistance regulator